MERKDRSGPERPVYSYCSYCGKKVQTGIYFEVFVIEDSKRVVQRIEYPVKVTDNSMCSKSPTHTHNY
jgi:hypothetical protein